jgi:hypothetical protein
MFPYLLLQVMVIPIQHAVRDLIQNPAILITYRMNRATSPALMDRPRIPNPH